MKILIKEPTRISQWTCSKEKKEYPYNYYFFFSFVGFTGHETGSIVIGIKYVLLRLTLLSLGEGI